MPFIATVLTVLTAVTPAVGDLPPIAGSDATVSTAADSTSTAALAAIEDARLAYRAAWALRQSGEFVTAVETADAELAEIRVLLDLDISTAARRDLVELEARLNGVRDAAKRDAELETRAIADGNEPTRAVLDALAANSVEVQTNPNVEKWIAYYTGPGRKTFELWWYRSGRYQALFEDVLQREGLPPDLVHLVFVESGFSVRARSRAAAVGPWQFIRGTGRLFGLTINNSIDERRDPEKSTVAAARYLKHLYAMFGDWPLALASYNCGEGRVLRAIKLQGTTNFWDLRLPRETEEYVPQFMAVLTIGRNPEKYGFADVQRDTPFEFDAVPLSGPVDMNAIAELAGCDATAIRDLNPALRRNGVSGRDGVLSVRVPKGAGPKVIAQLEEADGLPGQHALVTHRVRKGETLSGIGKRYGVSANLIALENNIGKKNYLRIGQTLDIPTKLPPPKLATIPSDDPRAFTDYVPHKQIRRIAELSLTGHSDPEGRVTVRVGRGESLSQIAQRYGVTVSDIKAWNNLSSTRVRRGTRLKIRTGPVVAMQLSAEDSLALAKIPVRRGYSGSIKGRHKVRSGETLGSIAGKYGTSVSKLKRANGLRSSRIYAGQTLKIPGRGSTATRTGNLRADGTYKVHKGETLGGIANRTGASVASIKRANGLKGNTIRVGQVLKIPGAGGASGPVSGTYRVRSGDTLIEIAQKHGTSVSALKRANGIRGSTIRAGQKLKIPAG